MCVLEYKLSCLFDLIECPNPPLHSALKSFYRQQEKEKVDKERDRQRVMRERLMCAEEREMRKVREERVGRDSLVAQERKRDDMTEEEERKERWQGGEAAEDSFLAHKKTIFGARERVGERRI